jgi:Type IIB DNA topoisomerase
MRARIINSACPAQLFRVLDLTHEAITHDIPTTKRCAWSTADVFTNSSYPCSDVYYKDVALFKRQRTVDNVCRVFVILCPNP